MQKPKRASPKIMHRAGELRKEPSAAETKLWAYLRTLREDGIHFRRQHAIGPYITDFSPKGDDVRTTQKIDYRSRWPSLQSQHLDQEEYDSERTVFLEAKGYHVLRFWNSDVMNKINDVMGVILEAISSAGTITE